MTKLIKGLDKSGLSVRDQILLFEKMNRMLQTGIKKSLLDQAGAPGLFQEAFPRPISLKAQKEKLKKAGQGTGQLLDEQILADLKKIDLSKKWWEVETCFAAGTLVHTKEGLVPIEQIKVGDWVLSKHESGEGERAYKRVVRTFVHEDEQVVRFSYGGRDEDGRFSWGESLLVTPNHPVWVVSRGWKEVGQFKVGNAKPRYVEILDGLQAEAGIYEMVYATTKPTIGWLPESLRGESLYHPGTLYDVSQNKYVMDEEQPQYSKAAWWGEDRGLKGKKPGKEHLYRATVYNIEVEDFHTYYVGKRGVWVHNKNLQINLQGGVGLTARVNPTVFHTRAELLGYLRKNGASVPSDANFIIRSQHESQYLWRGELQPRSAKFEDKVQARLYKHYDRENDAAASKLTVGPAILVEGLLGGLAGAMKTGAGPAAKRALQLKVKSLAFLDQILKRGVIEETPLRAMTREAECEKTYVVESPVKNAEGQLVSEGRVVSSETFAKEVKGSLEVNKAGQVEPACFMADTLVHTINGLCDIQFVGPGSWVLSRNAITGEQAYRPVLRKFEHENRQVYGVTFVSEDGRTDSLGTTAEHPFWVRDVGWVEAAHLQPGQLLEICDPDGRDDEYRPEGYRQELALGGGRWTAKVLNVNKPEGVTATVYNFEVEEFHTYFVGLHGVWVHNTKGADPVRIVLGRSTPDALRQAKYAPKVPAAGKDAPENIASATGEVQAGKVLAQHNLEIAHMTPSIAKALGKINDQGKKGKRVVASETFATEVKGNLKLNEAGDTVPGCFPYDTFVWTEQGMVEIQFLTPGAEVLSRCEVTGEIRGRKVVNHFIYEDRQIYDVALTYEEDGEELFELLETTAEHPFWIAGKGWTETRHLEIGQMMATRKGGTARITDVTKSNRFTQVFNIEVEGFHTYFVGFSGTWVHNKSVGSYGPYGEVLPRSHPDATVVPGKNVPNPSRQALHQA